MKERIRRKMPHPLRKILKQVYYFPFDTFDLVLGRRDELTPPRRMISIGGGDFTATGKEFLRYFKGFGNLKPSESVLDVGCGIGRMAIPLTRFLIRHGSYEGFDIVKRDIDWCIKNISSKYTNFHFQWANISNRQYNPNGKYEAAKYKFPYSSEAFDFVFLTSVFTHMLPEEMENYLSEITRVLRKDGRSLITFFLLNDESRKLIRDGKTTLDFRYSFKGYSTIDKGIQESAVAYDEQYIRALYKNNGMILIEPIHYGSWCGRQDFLSYQDIIVAQRHN